jgi:hypothetical protein
VSRRSGVRRRRALRRSSAAWRRSPLRVTPPALLRRTPARRPRARTPTPHTLRTNRPPPAC